ncbi:uncharacterized protein N7515_009493 [Penicillium bovifimosum]|uniref:Uncharacterized protein n=1 Tax=Penicillium bovifimosum TaxID=126998 RepID=A0A9W9GJE6_9EURO|nr:uncharacterized protein N7515_009493 [Penicillium bovifimosum]KAJ5121532.1 hypothetical protein N7515_009493 [Penicillium bovifimosum]
MVPFARNSQGVIGWGNPNNYQPTGTRDNGNMNPNSSFVPTGPRNYQNNGAQHYRGNKNQHANANCYKGKNFRPDFHRTKREDVSQSRVDQGVRRTSVRARPGPHSRRQPPRQKTLRGQQPQNCDIEMVDAHPGPHSRRQPRRQKTLRGQQPQNYDIEMMDAPSYEPNDIEMPDAPPLFQEFGHGSAGEIHDLKTRLQEIRTSLRASIEMGLLAEKQVLLAIDLPGGHGSAVQVHSN